MKALVALLPLLLCLPAHAEIYKWTDENGRVHFGDKPTGKQAEVLAAPAAAAAATPAASAPDAAGARERQRRLLEAMQADREEQERAEREKAAGKARLDRKCQQAASTLKRSEGRVLYETDDAGQERYLSPEQTREYLDGLRAALQEHCQ